jgi:Asp/Glu/hydantoin racemase
VAENAVLALLQAGAAEGYDGVIIAAFGDPGLARAKALLPIPVTGIAEAGMLAAAEGGRRFAVVTTTPNLAAPIAERAAGYGLAECFGGVHVTPGDPPALMADPEALDAALFAACQTAIAAGARAIVIGGGPLAVAARRLSGRVPVPLIEPVVAAVRLAERRAR